MIVNDPNKYIKPMAAAILEVYHEVIMHGRSEYGPINEDLAENVVESVPNNKVLKKLIPEYLKFEGKPSKWAF